MWHTRVSTSVSHDSGVVSRVQALAMCDTHYLVLLTTVSTLKSHSDVLYPKTNCCEEVLITPYSNFTVYFRWPGFLLLSLHLLTFLINDYLYIIDIIYQSIGEFCF